MVSQLSTITHLWQFEQVYILFVLFNNCLILVDCQTRYGELWLNKVCYCKRRIQSSRVKNLSCSWWSSDKCDVSECCSCYSTLWELNKCRIRKWRTWISPSCSFDNSLASIVCVCCLTRSCCTCLSRICCIECKIEICSYSPWRISTLKNCFENIILGCIGLRHRVKIKVIKLYENLYHYQI